MQVRIRFPVRPPAVPSAAGGAPQGDRSHPPPAGRAAGSARVAAGILISRVTGLVRERVIAHYFGNSSIADAFRAAIRIPNLLNNLFGEGVLSASFVTVYAKLRAAGEDREAQELAEAVFALLSLAATGLSLLGVAFTPLLIDAVAPGFSGDKRALTILLVRILFPGTALLVMSAWCLGVLNSHRRFLLSYTAPVVLNLTMIGSLLAFGRSTPQEPLAVDLAWASVLGSALQFGVQLPRVLSFLPRFRPRLTWAQAQVRLVFRNFGPVFLSRGVVQISGYLDSMIASLLPTGAVAALGYAQTIALLPISLFSMSVSAAELPALSEVAGEGAARNAVLQTRLSGGLASIAFLIVPSAVGFLLLGDVIVGALYQSGRFSRLDTEYVWAVLAGSAVGLLATALGRLYASVFYALFDTRTPLRFAVYRVVLTVTLGFAFALGAPKLLGIDPKWGVAGLTASAGIAGWLEFVLLRRELGRRIGAVYLPRVLLVKLWASALAAAGVGWWVKLQVGFGRSPLMLAICALGAYGVAYLSFTLFLGIDASRTMLTRAWRLLSRSASTG